MQRSHTARIITTRDTLMQIRQRDLITDPGQEGCGQFAKKEKYLKISYN
jgi:hypothetical protein